MSFTGRSRGTSRPCKRIWTWLSLLLQRDILEEFCSRHCSNCNLVQKAFESLRTLCSQWSGVDCPTQYILIICEDVSRCHQAFAVKTTRSCSSGKNGEYVCRHVQLKAAAKSWKASQSILRTRFKSRGGLGIIVHFSRTSHLSDGPDIVQVCTRPCPSILRRFRASCLPIRRLNKPKNPLLRTLPNQSADLALDRLVVKTCCQAVSPCCCCAFLSARPMSTLQPFGVTLFLAITHFNSPESSSTFSRPNS